MLVVQRALICIIIRREKFFLVFQLILNGTYYVQQFVTTFWMVFVHSTKDILRAKTRKKLEKPRSD